MGFNELNSVEHYIIHKLSGVNLNPSYIHSPAELLTQPHTYGNGWDYKTSNELQRGDNEVLIESELKESLIRLNPDIADKPELADEVIHRLRKILIEVNQVGLVKANEEFFK